MMQPDAPSGFVRVPGAAEIPAGSSRAFSVGRYEVAVFNVGGDFYAIENSCPHQGGPLADGWLEDALVTCPWHGWCFDVRSGKMTLGDYAQVPRFAVQRAGRDLYISTRPLEEIP
jgi:nitrite reductase/ring-hydroxylating ferredoxin subunit